MLINLLELCFYSLLKLKKIIFWQKNVYFFMICKYLQGGLESRGRSHRNLLSRIATFIWNFWNIVDLLSYALLLSALFVRHFYNDENFLIARRMFALSLLVMYLRFLEVFLIHRTLGPTLIMIKEMVNVYEHLY